ncbi:MAG: fibronectin type III domain-containing protein [Candidatus Eisenbacteria sp.]|nr:fibronectin type III domain-containing protein [Candidatus Eisenbacteria bacterium]
MKRSSAFLIVLLIVGLGCGGDDDGGISPDTTPPAKVSDLSVTTVTDSSATLAWEAPGDDGTSGTASAYDIRYATDMITDENWSTADSVDTPPTPGSAGSEEGFTVTGLSSSTLYYFALKTIDDAANWSGMSNVASDTTLDEAQPVPVLAISADSLEFGSDLTEQTFTIANAGTGMLNWTATYNATRLTVVPGSGVTTTEPDTITVTVNRAGLAPGDYEEIVTITPGGATPQELVVRMSVGQYVGRHYFPMALGDTWNYKYFGESTTATGTVEFMEDTHTFTDGIGRRSEWEMAPMSPTDPMEILFFGYEGDNAVWFGEIEYGTIEYINDPVDGLAIILSDTMQVGSEWILNFIGGESSAEFELLGIEDVTVPAGTFEDCLKIQINLGDNEQTYFTDHLYFAKHMGIVKAERFWEEQSTDGFFFLVNSDYKLAELQSAIIGGVSYPGTEPCR